MPLGGLKHAHFIFEYDNSSGFSNASAQRNNNSVEILTNLNSAVAIVRTSRVYPMISHTARNDLVSA